MRREEKQRPGLFCRELSENVEGIHYRDENEITTELFSFDEFFYVREEGPIFIRTELNEIVSLHRNFGVPCSTRSRLVEPEMDTHHQLIHSNIAVTGHDKWDENHRLKRVTFRVNHADNIFVRDDRSNRLIDRNFEKRDAWKIFECECQTGSYEASYSTSYTGFYKPPTKIWSTFSIEFNDPPALHEYIEEVSYFVQFLSFSLGAHMRPEDIEISRFTEAEMLETIRGGQRYPGDHAVSYIWPAIEVDAYDLWETHSVVNIRNKNEIKSLCECLQAWIERRDVWRNAAVSMMTGLRRRGEVSSERLIAACRWFEEIPSARGKDAISIEDIGAITKSAVDVARQLGYGDVGHRISSSIKRIKQETNEARFQRLVGVINKRFGPSFLDAKIVGYLKDAISFRGRAAHGNFEPENDKEFRKFAHSTYALEALCFLLMCCELPIRKRAYGRLKDHPFVRDYLQRAP